MARKKRQPQSAARTLEEIESRGDRLTEWVSANPMPILGTALAVIVIAAIWGISGQRIETATDESAAALAKVQEDYRVAMGATPGSIEIAEPANPETARAVRAEYVALYEEVARDHAGQKAAALALLEAGELHRALGDPDAAVDAYERALEALPTGDVIRAFAHVRIGAVQETAGRFAEAGDAYAAAGEITLYPLRFDALADAARTYSRAGNRDGALAAFARIEMEAPEYQLAPYLRARRAELRAAAAN